jgi:hypothetical protein
MLRYEKVWALCLVVFWGEHMIWWEGPDANVWAQSDGQIAQRVKVTEKSPSAERRRGLPADSSTKEGAEGVWVIAEAAVQLADDMTVQEGRSRSLNEARRKAIEKAVGIFVKGNTVVYNHVLAEDLVQSIVHGIVTDEQILEEGVREVGQQTNERATLYATKLKARVRPVQAERKAEFSLKATLNQTVFREGEEMEIRVSSGHDVYLHLFSVGQDDAVTVLFPNRFAQDTLVRAEQQFVFPDDSQRAMGIRLRVFPPSGAKRATERIKVIATRKKCDLIKAKFREAVFQVYEGKDTGLMTDLLRELALLEDADWAEATIPYEVYK